MANEDEIDDGMLVTGFALGPANFGIDARTVLEVAKVGEMTQVHGAPLGVVGIRNLRGRIVTLVDMATHLGLGAVELGPENRLLIMEHRGDCYGFLVDAIGDAIALAQDRIESPPTNLDPALSGKLQGIWRDPDRVTAILNPQALFQWDEPGVSNGIA